MGDSPIGASHVDPGPSAPPIMEQRDAFRPKNALVRSPRKTPGAGGEERSSAATYKPSSLDRFFSKHRIASAGDLSVVATPPATEKDPMDTDATPAAAKDPHYTEPAGNKRKASPLGPSILERSSSLTELRGANGKRPRPEEEPFARLTKEVARLESLVKAHPTTKKEIKDGIGNLRLLVMIAKNEWTRPEAPKPELPETSNPVTCDGESQTPREISTVHVADFINRSKQDADKREEILKLNWPKDAFEFTRVVKGGLMKTNADTVRVIVCKPSEVATNSALLKLGQALPALAGLSDANLPPGKVATVRCGGAVEIDGVTRIDNTQCIVVVNPPSLEESTLTEFLGTVSDEARKVKPAKIFLSFPDEVDCTRGRMMAEISLKSLALPVDIVAGKLQRTHSRKPSRNAEPSPRTSSFKIVPSDKKTLADIVRGLKTEINPEAMGVKIHRMEETKNGDLHIVYKESSASKNTFMNKVQSAVSGKAKVETRTSSIIISGLEAGVDEDYVIQSLATALAVPKDHMRPGKISSNFRGSSLIVSMPQEMALRAIELGTLQQSWTRARIREKVDPDFCGTCQSYGHRHCNKAQVEKRCFNCGTTGHTRAECKNPTACHVCMVEGHRSNGMACPSFRRMVYDKRAKC